MAYSLEKQVEHLEKALAYNPPETARVLLENALQEARDRIDKAAGGSRRFTTADGHKVTKGDAVYVVEGQLWSKYSSDRDAESIGSYRLRTITAVGADRKTLAFADDRIGSGWKPGTKRVFKELAPALDVIVEEARQSLVEAQELLTSALRTVKAREAAVARAQAIRKGVPTVTA